MKLRDNISVVFRICNEEYWIHYAIRPWLEAEMHVYVGDTGSKDATMDILRDFDSPISTFMISVS